MIRFHYHISTQCSSSLENMQDRHDISYRTTTKYTEETPILKKYTCLMFDIHKQTQR